MTTEAMQPIESRVALRNPNGQLARALVGWYGLYQAVHILVNTRGLCRLYSGLPVGFPAPAPASGWPVEMVPLFIAIGWADLTGAFLTLVFVRGYFAKKPWQVWTGSVSLTISMYAAFIYNYCTLTSGAWAGANIFAYAFVDITFVPIALLFVLFGVWFWNPTASRLVDAAGSSVFQKET